MNLCNSGVFHSARYSLLLGGQKQHGIRRLPNTSINESGSVNRTVELLFLSTILGAYPLSHTHPCLSISIHHVVLVLPLCGLLFLLLALTNGYAHLAMITWPNKKGKCTWNFATASNAIRNPSISVSLYSKGLNLKFDKIT